MLNQVNRKPLTVLWMGIAFAVALGLASAALAFKGTDQGGIVLALRMTARWAFLPFFLAYSGRAMADLFGPVFKPLAARGREFGLAFAAAMSVHLTLVIWLYQVSTQFTATGRGFYFFALGMVWIYLLALFSFGNLPRFLGSRGWHALRLVGMNYLLLAFAVDLVPIALHHTDHYELWRAIQYAPFAALNVAAPLLVLAAAARRRLGTEYRHAGLGPVIKAAFEPPR